MYYLERSWLTFVLFASKILQYLMYKFSSTMCYLLGPYEGKYLKHDKNLNMCINL